MVPEFLGWRATIVSVPNPQVTGGRAGVEPHPCRCTSPVTRICFLVCAHSEDECAVPCSVRKVHIAAPRRTSRQWNPVLDNSSNNALLAGLPTDSRDPPDVVDVRRYLRIGQI